jgi:hypothetical protein
VNSDVAPALMADASSMEVFVMTRTAIGTGMAVAALLAFSGPRAFAADAAHPYSNVNHSVDAGNDTGDSQVDQLNQQQLQKNGQSYQGGGSGQGWSGQSGAGASGGRVQPGYAQGYGARPAYYGYPRYVYPYPYPAYAYAGYPWRPWPWWRRRVWVGPGYWP